MRGGPTTEDILELVNAALLFKVSTENFAEYDTDPHCPCCLGKDGEHLASCRVERLMRNLKPFLGVLDTYPDVGPLILAVRDVVGALDFFDPQFYALYQSLIENLKEKLTPFESPD
jgi:hypothetical protein